MRKDYAKHSLEEQDCPESPIDLLHAWIHEAMESGEEANAMTLSTVNAQGTPSSRIVLIRGLEKEGLTFFTNYASKKGSDIGENPNVAINFFWPWLERQVRIEGKAEKLPREESDRYFASRPRESQIGAWASEQSGVLATRGMLDELIAGVTKRFEGVDVPRPPHWGGYLVRPRYVEFWQGRPNRLHDRIAYSLVTADTWERHRLFP